ncbi:mevalonate kinase, partial [Streptococcus danieliae]|nr:mevalonate kinase [Streptococcus danieliae]
AGALGAKMSGGGLGGCVIALAATLEDALMIREKLFEKGAQQVWIEKV